MLVNHDLFEGGCDIHLGTTVNQDANTDITGDRINLARYDRAYYLIVKPSGTAGDDLNITPLQHTAATGGSSKALTVSRLWHKVGTLASTGTWTAVELTTPSSDFDLDSVNSTDLATDTSPALVLIEVLAESLDSSNGYTFVSIDHEGDDIGNAMLMNGLWFLCGSRYPQAVPISPLS